MAVSGECSLRLRRHPSSILDPDKTFVCPILPRRVPKISIYYIEILDIPEMQFGTVKNCHQNSLKAVKLLEVGCFLSKQKRTVRSWHCFLRELHKSKRNRSDSGGTVAQHATRVKQCMRWLNRILLLELMFPYNWTARLWNEQKTGQTNYFAAPIGTLASVGRSR